LIFHHLEKIMDYTVKTDEELLYALETAGRVPAADLLRACLQRQEALAPALLAVFQESAADEWAEDDPRWFRGVHAGRLLLAYREERALPVFEQLYASLDEGDQDFLEWFGWNLAHYGATAVPAMTRVLNLDTQGAYHYGRSLAATTLKIIALQHPETKEGILKSFRALLPPLKADGVPDLAENQQPDEIVNVLAIDLSDLRDEISRPQIEALFALDWIDPMMISLKDYQAAFADDAPPPDESAFTYDLIGEYQSLRDQQNREARRDLLRDQGLLWPKPDPEPYTNRAADWFNDKLLNVPQKDQPKIGRNDPCPCGSGKKYKKCHGKKGAPPLPG
jgi:hypothetical protein